MKRSKMINIISCELSKLLIQSLNENTDKWAEIILTELDKTDYSVKSLWEPEDEP